MGVSEGDAAGRRGGIDAAPRRLARRAAVLAAGTLALSALGASAAGALGHPRFPRAAAASARAPLARGSQPAPSLFGINTGTFDTSEARLSRDLPTAARLGARWVHFTGDSVKYLHGRPSFRVLDAEVNRARSLGLGVVISLGGVRAACSIAPRPADPTDCPPTSATDLARYAGYLRSLLRHFAGRVSYFESWVEPNHRSMWPSGPNPAQYAALLLTEYRVLHATEPADKLMFAGVADFGITDGSPNGIAVLPYTDAVLSDLEGRRAFDLVALHAYRFPPSLAPADAGWTHYASAPIWRRSTWTEQLQAYEALFRAHGYGSQRLWLTEFGWPGNRTAAGDYFPSLQAQAQDVAEAYSELRSPALSFVQAAFWFNERDYTSGTANPDPGFFAHYGLLFSDFSPKPAAAAFQAAAASG